MSGTFLYHKIQDEKLYSIIEEESKKLSLILRLDNYALTARLAYRNMQSNMEGYENIYSLNIAQIPILIEEIETYTLSAAQQSILNLLKKEKSYTYTNGLFISKVIKSIEELTKISYLLQKKSINKLRDFNKKIAILYFSILSASLCFLCISIVFAFKHIGTPTKYLIYSMATILKGDLNVKSYKGKKVGEFVELIYYFSELLNHLKDMEQLLKEKDSSSVRYMKQVDILLVENKKLNKLRPVLKQYLSRIKNIDETISGDFNGDQL